jgi:tRNA(fMet)-specific endonuclease VapC
MPANGSIVLDTNLAVKFLASDRQIQKRVAETDRVIVSTVVLGELFYGAQCSDRLEENLRRVEDFAAHSEVVDVRFETARRYGVIKNALRQKGTLIPDNDIWIAALAQQYSAAVATRDEHFNAIDGLEIARW